MSQEIEFQGQVHSFPDSFSQDQIAQALSSYKPPSVAADIAKQVGITAPVQFAESLPSAIPSLLHTLGGIANKYFPGDPEAARKQQELYDLMKPIRERPGVVSQFLPQAQTVPGQYANTATLFGLSAATAPGKLLPNVIGGITGGLASEAAGQAMQGTEAEPYARVLAGLGGGYAGLRGAEGIAARQAASQVPAREAILNNATSEYKDLRSGHVAQPITQTQLDNLADQVKTAVNKEGPRPSVAPSGHAAIEEIRQPATAGAPDVADLVTARQNLKSFFMNPLPDPNKAVAAIAIPKIEAAIEQQSPGTMQRLKEADQNYAAAKVSEKLDKRINRAELRASGEHSGLNLGNKLRQQATNLMMSGKESLGLKPEELAALQGLAHGTTGQNLLRFGSNLLGGGGGLGATLLASAGLAGGGELGGHPELGLLPLGGIGMRMAFNRSVANQARNVEAMIRGRSALAQQMGKTGPAPRLTNRQAGLLAALYAQPAELGLLSSLEPAR